MSEIPRSANMLVELIVNNPGLMEQLQTNPEQTLRKLAEQTTKNLPAPAFVSDNWIYRIVVMALSIVAIAAIAGAVYLTTISTNGSSVTIPDIMTALGAAAIGALAGLLAPSPANR